MPENPTAGVRIPTIYDAGSWRMASYQGAVIALGVTNRPHSLSISSNTMSSATLPPNSWTFHLMSRLRGIVSEDEIITKDSPVYKDNSQPWAAQKDQKPPLVVRPLSAAALSKTVSLFYSMDIHFAVRGHGFMSSSAHDVIISMTGFDDFQLDREQGLATVGAGQPWIDVYRKIEDAAPDLTSVSCLSVQNLSACRLTYSSCRCPNSLC